MVFAKCGAFCGRTALSGLTWGTVIQEAGGKAATQRDDRLVKANRGMGRLP